MDRMNRSGQRSGSVGRKATRVTRTLLDMVEQGRIKYNAKVFDFGAGKWAQQTALLREKTLLDVTPYDVGDNTHCSELREAWYNDVVIMSNVLNVQESMRKVEELLDELKDNMDAGSILICNLPQSPRYGYQTPALVATALYEAGFEIMERNSYGSGVVWVCTA